MNAKKWLKSFIFFILGIVILFELKYQVAPVNRHEVDYLVKEMLPSLKNEKYETVILGDSLAHNVFSKLELKKNILDLTSNKAVALAGSYYILKRYLKNNDAPKEIYFFAIPAFLHYDLNENLTYSYFETVFTHSSEIKEIQTFKPELYSDAFNLDKYFESRKNALKIEGYRPEKRQKYIDVDEKELIKVPNFINEKIESNIAEAKAFRDKIEPLPKFYFEQLVALCKKENIQLTVVIEPIFKAYIPLFKGSKWDNYLKSKVSKGEIVYKNINDYYAFNSYFFKRDGRHITGKVNQYYQNLIDKYILKLH